MEKSWVRRNKWIFVAGPLGLAAFVALFGEVVMHLWNWLMPPLFGWHTLTFWQALGLLVLSRILFGGFSNHGNDRSNARGPGSRKWDRLSPEEREKLRQSTFPRCGDPASPDPETCEPA